MPNLLEKLVAKGCIAPSAIPSQLVSSTQYMSIMGSVAYGVSSDFSDMDIYGFCIPEKSIIFPNLAGYIPGFSKNIPSFDQWQQHHIEDPEKGVTYDISIYNIVKYFSLVMENNPNMVDSLFTPQNCILQCSSIAQMVREERHIFLHKGSWHKFKGYAYSQLHKLKSKEPAQGKRKELIEKYGYDVKFAYHVIRLLDEVEQILTTGTLDLQRAKEQLKAIREGQWPLEDVFSYFSSKEKDLEVVYQNSTLPYSPNEKAITTLLFNCLEQYYGDLSNCLINVDKAEATLQKIAYTLKEAGY